MVDFLDTFIGLFSVYLLLSLIVTAITQGIVNSDRINLKGQIINRIITNLVGVSFAEKIKAHPKFKELCSKDENGNPVRMPSYLEPAVFAEILIELIVGQEKRFSEITPAQIENALQADAAAASQTTQAAQQEEADVVTRNLADQADQNAAGEFEKPEIQETESADAVLLLRLREIWEEADFDVAAFKQGIIDWFDRVSERSYGWHKRKLNTWLMATGLAVAVLINADTIHIFQRLTNDEDLRQQFVTNAIDYTEQLNQAEITDEERGSEADAMLQEICEANGGENCEDAEQRSEFVVKALLPDLLPVIGWDAVPPCLLNPVQCFEPSKEEAQMIVAGPFPHDSGAAHFLLWLWTWLWVVIGVFWIWLKVFAVKVAGWSLTAMATSLGAPFWFDLLQKIIQIRGKVVPGGNKPKDTESKDGQPVTRTLAAKTALRASEVDATEIDSLNEFNHNNFGFDPVNIYWSARLAATAYLPDEDVEVFLAEYGAEGELLDIAHSDTQCLVAKTAKAAFISFRGTEKVAKDWFTDIDVKLTDSNWGSSTVKTHSGFTEALDSIWRKQSGATQPGIMDWIESNELAAKGIPIWFSGHSLGGALAALAALRLDMEQQGKSPRCVIAAIHTFGQPRVGDEHCAKEFDQRFANKYFRLINQRDIVPRVPFPKADILLAKVEEHIQEKVDTHTIAPEAIDIGKQEDYRYAHAGRVIYFNDLGRAIVDPQFWYRKLDTLVVPLDREQIKDALKQTAGDHAMTGYIERSRALFRFSEPDGGDD